MRDTFDLNITDDGILAIDLHTAIEQNFNASTLNFTLPTLDLKRWFPDLDLDRIQSISTPVEDEDSVFDGLSAKDLVDGDIQITGANILQAFENANLTTLRVPIKPTIEALLNITRVPTDIAHNFTIVDTFSVPRGKFGNTLGNVALVDCHYINRLFMSTYQRFFLELIQEQPFYYVALS